MHLQLDGKASMLQHELLDLLSVGLVPLLVCLQLLLLTHQGLDLLCLPGQVKVGQYVHRQKRKMCRGRARAG